MGFRGGVLDWITTTDHKKIGILYIITTFFFFLLAGLAALTLRTQLADNRDFLGADTYNQIFTLHGTTMIFLFVIPILAGFGNYLVPLMIGAKDMAFPRINALSYWLLPPAGLTLGASFITTGSAAAGWTSYAPLSRDPYSGMGMDLWIVALMLIGVSSILGAINFIATIITMRAPGMTMFRMPVFVWSVLITAILVLFATPVFTSALVMLFIDRNYGGQFFDPSAGGSAVLWQNIFWFYSHPAVYVMILPVFGMISEVIPVFSRKPLFGYPSMVFAMAAIGTLGFGVWAHHMFTTGAVLLPFFSFVTFLIAVPTGIKFFNWIATMWRGSLTFETPMLFAIGFLMLFLLGGITGAYTAAVPVDFHLQDTYFVVSHIHYVLFGGSVFGLFAGIFYWFPKVTGKRLDETLGRVQFWLMFIGMNLAFFPMALLGLDGMPRRIRIYDNPSWEPLNVISTVGAFVIATGILVFLFNFFATLQKKEEAPDNPWEGNTLEWWAASPPSPHNFERPLPPVRSNRPLWDLRHGAHAEIDVQRSGR